MASFANFHNILKKVKLKSQQNDHISPYECETFQLAITVQGPSQCLNKRQAALFSKRIKAGPSAVLSSEHSLDRAHAGPATINPI